LDEYMISDLTFKDMNKTTMQSLKKYYAQKSIRCDFV
jgi:hypothetical protein